MSNVDNRFEQPSGGSTDNPLVLGGTVESATAQNLKSRFLTVAIGDVSTANSVWVVPGFAGSIVKYSSVIDAAITGADAGLTLEIATVAVTGGAITIANVGSAAGTVDSASPSAANVFTAIQAIEIVLDGASTTTSLGVVTFELLPS